jgi:Skp family chaperone for outer membrane proteins
MNMNFPLRAAAIAMAVSAGLSFASLSIAAEPAAPAAAAAAPAAKGGLPPVIVALFDKESLFRESSAGKDFRKQLDELRNKFQGDLSRRQEDLRKKEGDLRNRQAIMSAEAFEAERKKFEEDVTQAQSTFEEKQREIQGAIARAEEEITKATTPILAELMRQKGATLLFDKAFVLISVNEFDITADVIKKLDVTLPKVKLELKPMPKPAQPGSAAPAKK